MNEPLWRGLTHQQVFDLVHAGPGPYVSDSAITAWGDAEAALRSIDADLAAAMAKAGDWEGVAADATRGGLTPLGSWAVSAAHAAQRAAITVGQHQEQVANVRAALPEPGPDPDTLSPFSFRGPGMAPREIQAAANAELAAQAFHVMDTYATNTGLIQHWAAPWSAPPTVTVAVAATAAPHPAAAGAGPNRTMRHAADLGAAAAIPVAVGAAGAAGAVAVGSTTGRGAPAAAALADPARAGTAATDGGDAGAVVAHRGSIGSTGAAAAGAGAAATGTDAGGAGAAGGVTGTGFGRPDGLAAGSPGASAAAAGVDGPPAAVSSMTSQEPAALDSRMSPITSWRDLPELTHVAAPNPSSPDDPDYAGSVAARPGTDDAARLAGRSSAALRYGDAGSPGGPVPENSLFGSPSDVGGSAVQRGGLPDGRGGAVTQNAVDGRGALSDDQSVGGVRSGAESGTTRATGNGSGYLPMTGGSTGGEGHAHRRAAFLLDDSGAFTDDRWFTEAVITPDDALPSA